MFDVNQKAKAFTLIELVVTMVLSAILVGVSYFVFFYLSQFQHNFSQKSDQISNIIQYQTTIEYDFKAAWWVESNGKNMICNWPDKKITYEFFNDYTIRTQQNIKDTFHIKTDGKFYFLNGEPIKIGRKNCDEVRIELDEPNLGYIHLVRKMGYKQWFNQQLKEM